MSFEEAEILRERAEAFLENAKRLIVEGVYDLAAFSLEQYFQLILKYKLLVKTGTYPRIYSLTRLVGELSRLSPQVRVLIDKEDHLLMLTKLEDAYIGSRYLPRRYSQTELHAMLRYVEEVVKPLVDGI